MKKILVMSDLHCGAMTGLTHPNWQSNERQKEAFSTYMGWLNEEISHSHFDAVIVNGDAIDGNDKKGGGVEAITTDRLEQVNMAYEIIVMANCPNVHIIAGTPYHVGDKEDFEKILADKLNASFRGHGYFNVENVEINVKHKISGASMPYLKATPLAKEIAQNRNWYMEGVEPKADILIRSHVHNFVQIDSQGCLGFTTAGLQSLGNRYGSRQCSAPVHFGMLVLEINKGDIAWRSYVERGGNQKVFSVPL